MFLEITLPLVNVVLFSYKDGGFYKKFQIFGFDFKIKKEVTDAEYCDALEKWYEDNTGEVLKLEKPQTINEKIQWLKLYDSNKLKMQLSDKIAARSYIAETIGDEYLIPVAGIWEKPEDIDFNALPSQFVLKCNNSKYSGIKVKNINVVNRKSLYKKVVKWLSEDYSGNTPECQYKGITPKVIVEEYIEDSRGDINEFKVLCFNGEPKYVYVDKHTQKAKTRDIYDLDWELQPFTCEYKNSGIITPPPANMHRMFEVARKLSKNFYLVRVDFYNADQKLYINGLNFAPNNGIAKFSPSDYSLVMGKMLTIPTDSNSAGTEKICA